MKSAEVHTSSTREMGWGVGGIDVHKGFIKGFEGFFSVVDGML